MSNRIIDAAEHFIASDKSDPFTRNRVYSHMARYLSRSNTGHGIASPLPNGEDAFYSAEPFQEERFYIVDGVKHTYHVTVYRNIRRP